MEWRYLGKLIDAFGCNFGGVYLIVHEGFYNRVVYVGTTNCIGRRMQQHFEGYLRGNRTIWKISKQEDAYSLMASFEIRDYVSYFRKLAEKDYIWASTTIERIMPTNLLLPGKIFDEHWKEFTLKEYLPNIGIWALKITPYCAKKAVIIESGIQQRLIKIFNLGRFFNHKDLTILGKIEFNDHFIKLKQSFGNEPNLDEASKLAFRSLPDNKIPKEAIEIAKKQLADVISERIEIKKDKQSKLLTKYPSHGSQWTPMEIEKLRVMLVQFNMTPLGISKVLGRKSSSIRKKIENNDKLTNRRWREGIQYL